MTEIHITVNNKLLNCLTEVASGLSQIAAAIEASAIPSFDSEITELGTSIERGLADLATAVDNME